MKFHRKERQRAEALLSASGQMEGAREVPLDPDAASLGAKGGIAYAWDGNSMQASVYAFPSYSDARAVEDDVRGRPDGARNAVATVNGSLLLWATADNDDQQALASLKELRSGFAGRE